MKHLFHVIDVDMTLTIFLRLNVVTSGDISEPSAMVIYIIKIGRFVCGQRCDWSARSAGLACAQRRPICAGRARAHARAGHARSAGQSLFKSKTSVASFGLLSIRHEALLSQRDRTLQ